MRVDDLCASIGQAKLLMQQGTRLKAASGGLNCIRLSHNKHHEHNKTNRAARPANLDHSQQTVSKSLATRQAIMSKHHNHPDYIANRKAVLKEQPICTVCNRQPSTQADHIIPVDAGGSHQIENLRGICAKCNNRLGHQYVTQRNQYRQTIRNESLAQNGIKTTQNTKKSKPFFYERKIQTYKINHYN